MCDRHHFVQIGIVGHVQFRESVRKSRMLAKLENSDIEVVDDPNLGRRHFMHVDLGFLGTAIKQDAEHRHWELGRELPLPTRSSTLL